MFAKLDNDVAPAFRKAAEYRHHEMSDRERVILALFISASVARLPEMIAAVTTSYYESRSPEDRRHIDDEVEKLIAMRSSTQPDRVRSEILKRDYFPMAWDIWMPSMVNRLLAWDWFWIQTDRVNPFVTSDAPVFLQKDLAQGIYLVSFPVSTEVAVLICNRGGLVRRDHGDVERVELINQQTINRANEFVICHQTDFPGDRFLARSEDKPQAG